MKMLSETLEQEKVGRQSDIDLLERKMFHEKERIKKEFLIKIKETKQNLLSMTEDQLHTTTKRTIMENEQMTTELQYQSRETERLLKMNTKLRSDNKELKRNVSLTEEAGREYAKKTYFYQKLIKKLHEKIQNQTVLHEDQKSKHSRRNGEYTVEGDNMLAGRSNRGNVNGSERGQRGGKKSKLNAAVDMKTQQRLVHGLRDKVEQLELNLNQVCNELDATRRQLHRVNQDSSGTGSGSGSVNSRSVLEFLITCLSDAKAEALLTETGEGMDVSTEPSMFPPSLRVSMITKVLQYLQQTAGESGGQSGGQSEGESGLAGRGSQLAEEFRAMFASGQLTQDTVSWGGAGAGGATPQPVKSVSSIAIQTDNVDPITVLRSVDVGPMSRSANAGFSFFTDQDNGVNGGGSELLDGGSSNMSESATSRFLRGPVRGWGAPAATYGMPKVSGPKTFRKRRTGLGATGKSVMTM